VHERPRQDPFPSRQRQLPPPPARGGGRHQERPGSRPSPVPGAAMKLILLSEVLDLGKRGDLVDVSDGYARNYLLPKKKAMKATEGALAHAESLRTAREEADKAAKEDATRIASQLAGIRVVIAAQA